jgi:murein DD-endopeptidase MepM/ murein hydrolase activator NlpD
MTSFTAPRLALLLTGVMFAACGGSGDGSTSGPTTPSNPANPSNPTPAPVATVDVSPPSPTVLAGATSQLVATTKDASGTVLTGRAVSWTSSNATVATVSAAGFVTTLAPGATTITATSEGKTGSAAVTAVDPTTMPTFVAPFTITDYKTSNYFDHNIPKEFVDSNGVYVPWWGESSLIGIDGHSGYDWQMPLGTPVRAVAAGSVVFVGLSDPFFCPILSTTTQNSIIIIDHALAAGVHVRSVYQHVSRMDVSVGQTVTEAQQIGLSGQTGCALAPHLHFEVRRVTETKTGQPTVIDPYGWAGTGADPWAQAPDGAVSINLWKAGQAPTLFRFFTLALNPNPGDNVFVAITAVRFQGVRDDQNPNNEYVEITRDNRFAPATLDLTGFTIKNKAGDTFTFPAGFTLTTDRTVVKVFSGSGTNTSTELYWGQGAGKWNNLQECVKFFNAAGVIRNQVGWGSTAPCA